MALYQVVRKAKDGAAVSIGTLRTSWGKPVELELRVQVSGRFELVPLQDDDEPTVPGVRRPSKR